jgi:hypothetical protein
MRKKFDAVDMKRKAQEEIYEEIKDLSPDDRVEYFRKAAEGFWREMSVVRDKKKAGTGKKSKRKTTTP